MDGRWTIQMPENVKQIIKTLNAAGYQGYAVGGCVRDSLMGRIPHDWDVTTNALPLQIKALFSHTVDTGIKHGTVTVLFKNESGGYDGYEVTTYRVDGTYEDHRHPDSVNFTTNLKEDLKRRDFTINAMAYNDEDGIIDIFSGKEDLEKGIIRAVGNPDERFSEDALRIMRAVRFSAQLGFNVEEETLKEMEHHSKELENVSAERIYSELTKLLASEHPEKILTAYETKMTSIFLPEFDRMMETEQNNPHHIYNVGLHTVEALRAANVLVKEDGLNEEEALLLKIAVLLHDVAKPVTKTTDEKGIDHFYGHPAEGEKMAIRILKRLKSDNHTIDVVSRLVKYHDRRPGSRGSVPKKQVRKMVANVGRDIIKLVFEVQKADLAAQNPVFMPGKYQHLFEIMHVYGQIEEAEDALSIKELKVNGKDIMSLGVQGKKVGEILNALLERVLDDPLVNEHESLMEIAKTLV